MPKNCRVNCAQSILFFACDHGPKAALAPIARHYGEQVSTFAMSRPEWRSFLMGKGTRLLVCGTSSSEAGSMAERNVRLAAKDAGIGLACVEDFPGNYIHWDGAAADWLIVEGNFSIGVYQSRGVQLPIMAVIPAVRYDHLRGAREKPSGPVERLRFSGPASPRLTMRLQHWAGCLRSCKVSNTACCSGRIRGIRVGKPDNTIRFCGVPVWRGKM